MTRSMLAATLFLVMARGLAMAGGGTTALQPPQRPTEATDIATVDLLFDTDSAQLVPDARNMLLRSAKWAKCTKSGALVIEGHADVRGTQQHNVVLSAERAAAVRDKLLKMGVPSDRIVITVYGKNGPRRGSLAEDRRATVRAADRPVQPDDIAAMK